MEPVLLYITASSREEAISLSHELLSARLVACTNIVEHVTAMYHWQGEIEHKSEAIIIAKTMKSLADAATARVLALHSYSKPCVLCLPVNGGSSEFIEWIAAETKPKPD